MEWIRVLAYIALVSETFFWKMDYYDESCTYGSEGPCDPDKTTRVRTLMLAQDYWGPVLGATFYLPLD
jgi:Protein of unknown function (DUF3768)